MQLNMHGKETSLWACGMLSFYPFFLIEGLQTGLADRDSDGEITIDELYNYVYEKVLMATPKQTPRRYGSQQGQIVIAHNRTFNQHSLYKFLIPWNSHMMKLVKISSRKFSILYIPLLQWLVFYSL